MKVFIFGAIVVIFGLLVGVTWHLIPTHPLFVLMPLVFALSWTSTMILVRHRVFRYGISIFSVTPLTLFLGHDNWTLAGGLIGACCTVFAVWSIDRRYRAASAFSFRYVAGRGLKIFFTALALIFSFSYYSVIDAGPVDAASILPEDVFRMALRVTEGIIQKQLPGFHSDATVDDIFALIIQQQFLQSSGGKPESIPSLETIKKELPSQRREIIMNLSSSLGFFVDPNISGTKNVGTALYELSVSRAEPYLKPYSALIPSVMAIAFFFALKTMSVIYYYMLLLLLPAVFWALQASGFIERRTVQAEKEEFVLKM